jgi:glucose/arabinose dehydrogenase
VKTKRILSALVLLLTAAYLLSSANCHSTQRTDDRLSVSFISKINGIKKPTHIANAGDGSNRLFIVEQAGRIILVNGNIPLEKPFLDISSRVSCCGERGLLSVAFPPGYANKKYFYVNYTNNSGDTVVARYHVTSEPDIANPESEEILLTVKQPYQNHNGGQIAFGHDGFLYIGLGDGGSAGDPHGYAQNPGSLLGKILRIDVESGKSPYAIPEGNPFLKTKGYRPEIWALGLRNPWRFSFDRGTGDFYIADVGQNLFEEVDSQPASSRGGENYGWDIMEGLHCFQSDTCKKSGLVLPVVEYSHSQGCSVTGGMVYRGQKPADMQGTYIYGDYCSGRIWGLKESGNEWKSSLLADTDFSISTFGEDEKGNIYVADYRDGIIYKMEIRKKDR